MFKKLFYCICFLLTAGLLYQNIGTLIDDRSYPPAGEMVDLGGYHLHLLGEGQGNTTVLLESGLGLNSLDWALVQPEIAKFARVYSYDRAGLGWSDESPQPRTSLEMAKELHLLLEKAHIPPPYILVGHSLGGANIFLFALLYPHEVSGLVFVDSIHGQQGELLPEEPSAEWNERLTSFTDPYLGRFTSPFGVSRLFLHFSQINQDLDKFPDNLKREYLAKISTNQYARTVLEEDRFFEESLRQFAEAKTTLTIPIVVITAGVKSSSDDETLDPADRAWIKMQEDISSFSTNSTHLYAESSDHMIPWHEPDIIVKAVRYLIQNNQNICK